MLADAAEPRFDVLLFWALDRLTREGALQTLHYLNQLSKYGLAFRSFRGRRITGTGTKDKTAVMGILERGGKIRTS